MTPEQFDEVKPGDLLSVDFNWAGCGKIYMVARERRPKMSMSSRQIYTEDYIVCLIVYDSDFVVKPGTEFALVRYAANSYELL